MDRRRVVVTGMGAISPVGQDSDSIWRNLVAGKSGIRPITLFDASGFDVRIAGEAQDFDPQQYMPAREARRLDRFSLWTLSACPILMMRGSSILQVLSPAPIT